MASKKKWKSAVKNKKEVYAKNVKLSRERAAAPAACFYRGKLSSNATHLVERLRGEIRHEPTDESKSIAPARLSLMALQDAVGKLVAISGKKEKKALEDTLKTVEKLGTEILSQNTSKLAKGVAFNLLDRTVENLEYFVADSCRVK